MPNRSLIPYILQAEGRCGRCSRLVADEGHADGCDGVVKLSDILGPGAVPPDPMTEHKPMPDRPW